MARFREVCTRRLVRISVVALSVALPACGGGGGSPTSIQRSPFGVVGGSVTRFAIEGYNTIGGTRGWPDEELVEYGGAGISLWAAEIGQPSSRVWGIFQSVLQSEPGTNEIWWNILVRLRSGPPPIVLSPMDQALVTDVAAEIRRLVGPSMPIFVTPFPDYAASAGCGQVSEASIQASKLMADFAVARGFAERGPTLRPITSQNNNGPGDPCHQGPVGREQHGRDLRSFFGG